MGSRRTGWRVTRRQPDRAPLAPPFLPRMPIASINPATGETLATFAEHTDAELERRLALAAEAANRWRMTPVAERAAVVARIGALLDEDKQRIGRMMTLEMGKPIRAA